jgi:hypothetical protein
MLEKELNYGKNCSKKKQNASKKLMQIILHSNDG